MPAKSKESSDSTRRSSRKSELSNSSVEDQKMKKKNFAENSDEENEFDVDEPEEIQNNASDDDWTPEQENNSSGRRMSSRLRSTPRSRAPIIDPPSTSEEEENSDDSSSNKRKAKGGRRGRTPAKRAKVSSTSSPSAKNQNDSTKSVSSDSEVSTTNSNSAISNEKPTKDFTSGAFIILKADADDKDQDDPPIWKIDGKALLQKYTSFDQDGQKLYKNTSVYSGWTLSHKNNYYPVTVTFKQQTRKDHIVEFKRDQIRKHEEREEEREVTSSSPAQAPPPPPPPAVSLPSLPVVKLEKVEVKQEPLSDHEMDIVDVHVVEKPIPAAPLIKVKSFAVLPEPEIKTPTKPIEERVSQPVIQPTNTIPPVMKINKNYASGAFLVLRSEASIDDPPLWKIDGKSLLQKYEAFKENGKTFYKNTAEFSGWTLLSKNNYFPASVIFKSQNKKDHIVALERIKWDEPCEDN